MTNIKRCEWTRNDPLDIQYHDLEWGVPLHEDKKLFEFMVLDTFQAGLSWHIILVKRDQMRKAFDGFVPKLISEYKETKIEELLNNQGIIRNRLKIQATISNAFQFLKIQKEYGTFDQYLWQFTGNKPIVNKWQNLRDIPARTELSDLISKDLQKRGFKFVGSTICYAFMQAIGMVNDHTIDCFRYPELS
jgi:DNA-3-methyladenine glycosylase I